MQQTIEPMSKPQGKTGEGNFCLNWTNTKEYLLIKENIEFTQAIFAGNSLHDQVHKCKRRRCLQKELFQRYKAIERKKNPNKYFEFRNTNTLTLRICKRQLLKRKIHNPNWKFLYPVSKHEVNI